MIWGLGFDVSKGVGFRVRARAGFRNCKSVGFGPLKPHDHSRKPRILNLGFGI